MYTLTAAELSAFQSNPQSVSISFSNGSTSLTISNDDIIERTFEITRNSASGNVLEIGSVIASELTMSLNNRGGDWDGVTLEGASLFVSVTAGGTTIPLGYYTIDSAVRKQYAINITALDRMMQFDVDANSFAASTIREIITGACSACNVTCGISDWSAFSLASMEIDEIPDDVTYRTLLAYACEVLGVNAWIDYNGYLQIGWYASADLSITASNRRSGDISDESITITGIQLDDTLYGSEGYVIKIDGNPYASDTVGAALYSAIGGFTYYPFSAETLPMPHVWPMDKGTYTKSSTNYAIVITGWKFVLNGWNELAGVGESETVSGYATANPLTRAEQAVIAKASLAQTEALSERVQAMLAISDLASNSLGFYTTSEIQADGSIIVYTHDKSTIADSTTIFKKTSAGFFVSTDGGATYTNGYDSTTGTAVLNILSAIGIKAEWLDIDSVIQRINNDGTESIDSTRVVVDGEGLRSIISDIQGDIESNTTLIQDANSITAEIQSTVTDVDSRLEDAEESVTKFKTWITADSDGITIAKSDSTLSSKFTNDSLQFLDNGEVVAYISNQQFYIGIGEITDKLVFRHGSSGSVTAYWTMNESGHIVLKKGE